MSDLEKAVLATINETGWIANSLDFAEQHAVDHKAVIGVIKSLEQYEMVIAKDETHTKLVGTPEAQAYLEAGASGEKQVFDAITADGTDMNELQQRIGQYCLQGFRKAMEKKWVKVAKAGGQTVVSRAVESVDDNTLQQLQALSKGDQLPDKVVADLKKRKLVKAETWKTYRLEKGPKFALERVKPATELTADMLASGEWETKPFKEYSFNALGLPLPCGHLHPLLKVRSQFRKIFTQMGFSEMPTNNYVESSFWNFDALFQPQQHPARDAHDTFFLTKPAATPSSTVPQDYLERVRTVHESGGFGSAGYGYNWKEAEGEKNLLRTHTTAVSSRMLYKLAQEGFKPAKFFSVDRVFRNEAIDRTHLAEFHQIEGLVCDRGLTLGDLIGTLHAFFERLGLSKLRFKPAYNPYTEPSMEIFSYSEELGKWIEVGNSGMFRPEMLRPMGMPEDVNVIAWGLSLERPTMILYGIDNIRDLFGHKVSLNIIRKNPICRLGF